MISGNIGTVALLAAHLLASAGGGTIPAVPNEETCGDLCSSCDGVAVYEDGLCECSISASDDDGTECLTRMKRQARVHGLDLIACDPSADSRSARCASGHKHKYGRGDIDRVAKYFMQDGPMTGSIFVAPPYTQQVVPVASQAVPLLSQTVPLVGSSSQSDCVVGAAEDVPTQPESESSPSAGEALITQPKDLVPLEPLREEPLASSALPRIPNLAGFLGIREIAPQFLSLLGEVITRPILGLPQTIQSFSQAPGISDLVGAPASLLNSLADRMAQSSKAAKDNLDNFREVVGKARAGAEDGPKDPKQSNGDLAAKANPALGDLAPAPMQFVGTPAQMQLVGAALQAPLMTAARLVSAAVPSQLVGAPNPAAGQIVGAVPLIHSLGTVPLSSIYSQISPSYIVGSPLAYYPAMQRPAEEGASAAEAPRESLEESPLSSPPREKICKKSVRPSGKFTRDVRAVEEVKGTATTGVTKTDRTATRKPKKKATEDESVGSKPGADNNVAS